MVSVFTRKTTGQQNRAYILRYLYLDVILDVEGTLYGDAANICSPQQSVKAASKLRKRSD